MSSSLEGGAVLAAAGAVVDAWAQAFVSDSEGTLAGASLLLGGKGRNPDQLAAAGDDKPGAAAGMQTAAGGEAAVCALPRVPVPEEHLARLESSKDPSLQEHQLAAAAAAAAGQDGARPDAAAAAAEAEAALGAAGSSGSGGSGQAPSAAEALVASWTHAAVTGQLAQHALAAPSAAAGPAATEAVALASSAYSFFQQQSTAPLLTHEAAAALAGRGSQPPSQQHGVAMDSDSQADYLLGALCCLFTNHQALAPAGCLFHLSSQKAAQPACLVSSPRASPLLLDLAWLPALSNCLACPH